MSQWRENERNADYLMIHLFSHSLHEHLGNTISVPSIVMELETQKSGQTQILPTQVEVGAKLLSK